MERFRSLILHSLSVSYDRSIRSLLHAALVVNLSQSSVASMTYAREFRCPRRKPYSSYTLVARQPACSLLFEAYPGVDLVDWMLHVHTADLSRLGIVGPRIDNRLRRVQEGSIPELVEKDCIDQQALLDQILNLAD